MLRSSRTTSAARGPRDTETDLGQIRLEVSPGRCSSAAGTSSNVASSSSSCRSSGASVRLVVSGSAATVATSPPVPSSSLLALKSRLYARHGGRCQRLRPPGPILLRDSLGSHARDVVHQRRQAVRRQSRELCVGRDADLVKPPLGPGPIPVMSLKSSIRQ